MSTTLKTTLSQYVDDIATIQLQYCIFSQYGGQYDEHTVVTNATTDDVSQTPETEHYALKPYMLNTFDGVPGN